MTIFDPARLRSCSGSSDVSRIMRFAGECTLLTDWCCSLHPGDVGHFLSNGLAGCDPAPYCYVYASNGSVEALLLFSAMRSSSWGLLVHPHWRDAESESALISWAEQHLRHLL